MLAKLRARLDALAKSLGLQWPLLRRARRRYRANRKRAFRFHAQATKVEKQADECRAKGGYYIGIAEGKDKEAATLHHKAFKNHARAQFWLGRIKVLKRRIDGIEGAQKEVVGELRKYKKEHKVTIRGNEVTGGTPGQRFRTAVLASVANCSSGKRRNFYSMAGAWDVDHVITPGEEYGERSDCSSTVTGWCKAAGLPDPNGEDWRGGYTGTLIGQRNGWKLVSESAMKKKGWGYVVYGGGVGHHVEAYIGPGDRTGGHGSAPVDFGVVDLFGDGDYRCYILDTK
jgi:hypothetical protein